MPDTIICPICEIEIDEDDPTPGDDGVTEADLRSDCELCDLTYAQAWASATGKSERTVLAEYDNIRRAFDSVCQQSGEGPKDA